MRFGENDVVQLLKNSRMKILIDAAKEFVLRPSKVTAGTAYQAAYTMVAESDKEFEHLIADRIMLLTGRPTRDGQKHVVMLLCALGMGVSMEGELIHDHRTGSYWAVEIHALHIHTQGCSEKNALEMGRDAVTAALGDQFLALAITTVTNRKFTISAMPKTFDISKLKTLLSRPPD